MAHLLLIAATCVCGAAPSTVVHADSRWLARQGSGPYVLSRDFATYVLETDVTTEGTAIVIAGRNITLDLNGHRITYGNGPLVRVSNGGFEQGAGRDVPGWDLSGAPQARLAPNQHYLFGKRVLRIEDFAAPQTIVSQPIAIPAAHHRYAAHVTPGGCADWRTGMQLSVLDAATGRVLGVATRGNAERGTLDPVTFFAKTTGAVRLKFEVFPPEGQTTSIELDAAVVAAAFDYGIMATRLWDGEIPGIENLPHAVRAAYRRANTFTLRNGRVIQGKARGYGSPPLLCSQLNGLTIDAVETFTNGMDAGSLVASRMGATDWEARQGVPSLDVTVKNSVFRYDVQNVTNRLRVVSAVRVDGKGNMRIEANRILGAPQVGISGWNSGQYLFLIKANEIRHRAVVANGYAVALCGVQNFRITKNRIITDCGRGILLDGYSASPTEQGEIDGNYVEVQEPPNREQPRGSTARALRMRNNVDAHGPHRFLLVHDNTFVAKTGPGLARAAYGARISYVNQNGSMNRAGIVLANNVFRAITRDPERSAKALVLDGADAGIGIELFHNVFESNHISLQLGDSDGGDCHDVLFVSNTIKRLDGPAGIGYRGIVAGWWTRRLRGIQLLDMRCENGALPEIVWRGEGVKTLLCGWLLEVRVRDERGGPVPQATVRVLDGRGRLVFSEPTDAEGRVRRIPIITEVHRQEGEDLKVIKTETVGPHRVIVSRDGYDDFSSEPIELSQSRTLRVTLKPKREAGATEPEAPSSHS